MNHFPTLCIDNFYSDPDSIRKFALSQEFFPDPAGRWPGKRTKSLHLLNENLFQVFSRKVLSTLFDLTTVDLNWVITTEFHMINNLDPNKDSIKNTGWVHYDDGFAVLAGLIYLNPSPCLDSGTSIFKCIDESILTNYQEDGRWTNIKKKFYLEKNAEGYEQSLIENNAAFIETARFQNVYNRLVLYDGGMPHRFNSCFSDNDSRLVQVIFVRSLEGSFESPVTRIKKFPV